MSYIKIRRTRILPPPSGEHGAQEYEPRVFLARSCDRVIGLYDVTARKAAATDDVDQ